MEKVKIKISECEVVEHPFLKDHDSGAYWCLHCECVHSAAAWRENNFDCPTVGCDGDELDMNPFNRDFYEGEYSPMYPTSILFLKGAAERLQGK